MARMLQQATAVFCGLALYYVVLGDQTCSDSLGNHVIPRYADDVHSTDLRMCSEYAEIQCGVNYSPSILDKRPTLYFSPPPKDCKFLSVLSFGVRQEGSNASLQWLVYDIPSEELRTGFTGQDGNEKVIYQPPRTEDGGPTGHVVLVYCQRKTLDSFDCCGPEARNSFDVKGFARTQDLGDPAAGIYFGVTATGQIANSSDYDSGATCPS